VSDRLPHLDLEAVTPPRISPMRGAIYIGIGLVIALILYFMFSGTISFKRKEAQKDLPQIQMNPNVTQVVRPAEPPAEVVARPQQQGQRLQLRPVAPLPNIEEQNARKSEMALFGMKATTAAAGAVGKGEGEKDSDALPPNARPDALEASLQPTKMVGTRVEELPNPRWRISQGRLIPCIQKTRINTTLPGPVTALIPQDIRGETGDVVLLNKGAEVFGTIQHGLLNGLDRAAVLWQDITTPILYDAAGHAHQYRIAVNSPAASERGETGVDGDVNRHLFNPFPGKLGGIIGLSLIRGGIDAGVQYLNGMQRGNGNNNSTTNLNFNSFAQGGQSAADDLLRSYINIPDVMTRDEGLACSIFVVRDLDFKGAYWLQNNRSQR